MALFGGLILAVGFDMDSVGRDEVVADTVGSQVNLFLRRRRRRAGRARGRVLAGYSAASGEQSREDRLCRDRARR
jgi:hypothetical protein